MLYLDLQNGGELLKDMLTFKRYRNFTATPALCGQTLLYFIHQPGQR